MDNNPKEKFTIGEFAKLFGISKQTLFYYERNDIFSPSVIKENGYRYYSLEQYFIFEIIVSLRKLGFSLKAIGNYVKNRNIDSLRELLLSKVLEYDLQIELLQRNRNNLLVNVKRLQLAKESKKDCITLENCAEEYFVADDLSSFQDSLKQQVECIAKHNLPFAKSEIFNEYFMGYIIRKEDLLSSTQLSIKQIFTLVSQADEYANHIIKPQGLYAKIITPDGYHVKYEETLQKLLAFIERNELEIVGDAYLVQLSNYWSAELQDDYVTQISIHVAYK